MALISASFLNIPVLFNLFDSPINPRDAVNNHQYTQRVRDRRFQHHHEKLVNDDENT